MKILEKKKKKKNSKRELWIVCGIFLLGFLLGIVLVQLGIKFRAEYTKEESLLEIAESISFNSLFWTVLSQKFKLFLFLCCMAITVFAIPAILGLSFYYGILYGTMVTLFIDYYGIRGIWIPGILMFPHGFLLVPFTILLLQQIYEMRQKQKTENGYGGMQALFLVKSELPRIGKLGILLLIACILESFTNSVFTWKLLEAFYS